MSAKKSTTNANWYNVKNFKFERKVDAPTETSVARELEGGKLIHIEQFDEISGRIDRMLVHEEESADKSKQWEILTVFIRDEKGVDAIQMYFNDDASFSFLKRLPNVDLTKDVDICIRKNKQENSDKAFNRIDLYQGITDGKREIVPFLEQWKGKESQLPPWEQKTVNRKKVWDKSAQLEFFKKFINVKNAEIADINKDLKAEISIEEIKRLTTPMDGYGNVYQPTGV